MYLANVMYTEGFKLDEVQQLTLMSLLLACTILGVIIMIHQMWSLSLLNRCRS